MSAALGAFFGAPIGAALFALEIPHRRGLQYFEAIAPAIIAAIFSFAVFRLNTGMTIGGFYHFEEVPALSAINLLEGLVLGIIGAGTAVMFIAIFRTIGKLLKPLEHYPIVLATLGGLLIGLIALAFPQTLFFSEVQIQTVIETGASLGVGLLLAISPSGMATLRSSQNVCDRFHPSLWLFGGLYFPSIFYRC